ncbi:MurR/RpiR family transcriptional regulator [Enterococcus avium]|uniref:MurR/RpiR family transcriptional regulator n=1 Tax=Enterococcus avium TaxID=33945 RepID=UPI003D6A09E6
MSVERYGTFLLLLRLYNESPTNSTEKILSKYFLKRFDDIKSINIYDVSADCHVSRATVRRFFSKLDHESFLDFKNEFTIPYDISMFEKELDRKDYVKEHIQQINEIQKFFLNNNSKILEKIRTLAKVMHNAKNIYWLTSTSTTRMVEDIQMQFLRFNSFWDIIINYKKDSDIQIEENDVVIVLSSSSVMAHSIVTDLEEMTCPIYLVTLNNQYTHSVFTDIIRLTDSTLYNFTDQISNETVKEEVVNRRYATNLFFDFLYYEYATIDKEVKHMQKEAE